MPPSVGASPRRRGGCQQRFELFCLTLCLSGGRISEVLALTPAAIDLEAHVVNITTLKRRRPGIVRQVPLPSRLIGELNREFHIRDMQRNPSEARRRIWKWSRTTAWRRVKEVMVAADVNGLAAMPKGLRHGFGVNAFQSLVPPHLVQRWLGHASLRTTSIYVDVIGADERMFAERMWRRSILSRLTRYDFGVEGSWMDILSRRPGRQVLYFMGALVSLILLAVLSRR